MATHKVQINRAPGLTLWATVVAERLGYDREAALTFGKAVAGLNAQSKGRRLGIFEEPPDPREAREPSGKEPGKPFLVMVLGHRFRPDVPEGRKGWGAAGQLDLDANRSLAKEQTVHKRPTPLRAGKRVGRAPCNLPRHRCSNTPRRHGC